MDARQRRLALGQRGLGVADDDGQVLDPAIGCAEGDDPRLRRFLERHARFGHADEARRDVHRIGQHVLGPHGEQVEPPGQRLRRRGGNQGGQQARELGERRAPPGPRQAPRRARAPPAAAARPSGRQGCGAPPAPSARAAGGARRPPPQRPGRAGAARPRRARAPAAAPRARPSCGELRQASRRKPSPPLQPEGFLRRCAGARAYPAAFRRRAVDGAERKRVLVRHQGRSAVRAGHQLLLQKVSGSVHRRAIRHCRHWLAAMWRGQGIWQGGSHQKRSLRRKRLRHRALIVTQLPRGLLTP
jgi:hypothetical protein